MTIEFAVLVLLVVGLAFMALEAFVPSFGILGLGGAASFFAALVMMRDLDQFVGMTVDGPLMTSLGIIGVIVLSISAYFVRMAWKMRGTIAQDPLLGLAATVSDWQDGRGMVMLEGEGWAAVGAPDLKVGDTVTVTSRKHLILTVEKA